MPWPSPPARMQRPPLSTAFSHQEICAPGFRCASLVSKYGRGHMGDIDPSGSPAPADWDARFGQPGGPPVYEDGCPARGTVGDEGKCVDGAGLSDKHGPTQMCWATDRYLADPEGTSTNDFACIRDGDCVCVRGGYGGISPDHLSIAQSDLLTTASAGLNKSPSIAGESFRNLVLQMGNFKTHKPLTCVACSEFDGNSAACNHCGNCSMEGGTCKPADAYKAARVTGHSRRDGQPYLPSFEAGNVLEEAQAPPHSVEAVRIPHFPMTFPALGLGGQDLPQDEWRTAAAEKLPEVQRFVDAAVMEAKGWKAPLNDTEMSCCSPEGNAFDVGGKVERMEAMLHDCRRLQRTHEMLAQGHTFPNSVQNGGDSTKVNCEKGATGSCVELNCYTQDRELDDAMALLKRRNAECKVVAMSLYKNGDARTPDFHQWSRSMVVPLKALAVVGEEAAGGDGAPLPDEVGDQTNTTSSSMPNAAVSLAAPVCGCIASLQRCSLVARGLPGQRHMHRQAAADFQVRNTYVGPKRWPAVALAAFLCC